MICHIVIKENVERCKRDAGWHPSFMFISLHLKEAVGEFNATIKYAKVKLADQLAICICGIVIVDLEVMYLYLTLSHMDNHGHNHGYAEILNFFVLDFFCFFDFFVVTRLCSWSGWIQGTKTLISGQNCPDVSIKSPGHHRRVVMLTNVETHYWTAVIDLDL